MRFLKKSGSKTIDFTKLPDSRIQINKNLKVSGDCVDLRENNLEKPTGQITSAANSVMDFLGNSSQANTMPTSTSFSEYSSNPNELIELKRVIKKSSGRIEDNSNELYKLMQKIELLERKIDRLEGR